jgi:hypothetical protein
MKKKKGDDYFFFCVYLSKQMDDIFCTNEVIKPPKEGWKKFHKHGNYDLKVTENFN